MIDSIRHFLLEWILTIVIFAPMLGAVALFFVPKEKVQTIRYLTLAVSGAVFIISLILWRWFKYLPKDAYASIFQLQQGREWISVWGVNYRVGIDGISLLLILLTTFLTPLTIWSTFHAIEKRVKEFMIFFLILETAMIGAFAAMNMFLFYVFWELLLIPMYFIIGVWGGERRIYAAIKFFLFTMVGSVLMLVAIIALGWMHKEQFGVFSLDYADLMKLAIPLKAQIFMFIAFGLAFAIKVPMFPFHTWLPDAHVEAPTAGSVILAGVLLKMGTYGLLRYCIPLFPEASLKLVPLMMALAVIGIIYGALVSTVQPDLKKLVAYSSVSHLGFVALGMFAMNRIGIQGSVLQMINHGLSTGALFLLVGMIYERRHTRLISEFGGLSKVIPIFGTIFMIVMLSSVGLPGLNGFIGEFLILLGTFTSKATPYAKIFGALAATGVIFAAVYLLWMFQRVMFGPLTNEKNKSLKDLDGRELLILLPILLFIFWIGIYPKTFTDRLGPSVDLIVERVMPGSTLEKLPQFTAAPHGEAEDATGLDEHGEEAKPEDHAAQAAESVPATAEAQPATSEGGHLDDNFQNESAPGEEGHR